MPLTTSTRMVAPFLDRLTDEELDSLPYGIVQLDAGGHVRTCNVAELENAGLRSRPLGLHYFLEVNPSANAPEFYGRFLEAIDTRSFDETFQFTFSCVLPPRRVQVRLYYCARTRSVWIFTACPDGSPLVRVTAFDSTT